MPERISLFENQQFQAAGNAFAKSVPSLNQVKDQRKRSENKKIFSDECFHLENCSYQCEAFVL